VKRGRTRIDDSIYPLFITTTIIDFVPVFRDPILAKRCLEVFEDRRHHHQMRVYAYVLMPSHLHAITHAPSKGATSSFIREWKSLTAELILASIPAQWSDLFAQAARRYGEPERNKHKVWMARFDDVALYNQNTFTTKLEYIHCNPVKAGLARRPEDYSYSSAPFYADTPHAGVIALADARPLLAGRDRWPR
jgi:putative transposase